MLSVPLPPVAAPMVRGELAVCAKLEPAPVTVSVPLVEAPPRVLIETLPALTSASDCTLRVPFPPLALLDTTETALSVPVVPLLKVRLPLAPAPIAVLVVAFRFAPALSTVIVPLPLFPICTIAALVVP